MAKNLVIVESPSKTKTIQGILGRDYKVVASKGHIRQLAKSRTKNDINLPISRNDKNAHISIPGVQKKVRNLFLVGLLSMMYKKRLYLL